MSTDRLEEYFNHETPDERKKEIRREIAELSPDHEERVMMELGEAERLTAKTEMLKERFQKISSSDGQKRPFLKIAAAILLLAASIFIFRNVMDAPSAEGLFNDYYQPYDGVVTLRGESSELEEGMTAYNTGKFDEALEFFLRMETKEISDGQLRLLISSCYLSLNETDKSLDILEAPFMDETVLILSNQSWYRALSHLRKGNISASRELLEKLIDSDSPFKTRASELLKESVFDQVDFFF